MPRFAKPCLERTYTQAPHAQTAVVGIESRPALSTGDFHVWIPSGELCAGGAFILLRKHLQEEAVLSTRASRSCALHIRGTIQKGDFPPPFGRHFATFRFTRILRYKMLPMVSLSLLLSAAVPLALADIHGVCILCVSWSWARRRGGLCALLRVPVMGPVVFRQQLTNPASL